MLFGAFLGVFLELSQREEGVTIYRNSLIFSYTHEWTRTITMLLTRT